MSNIPRFRPDGHAGTLLLLLTLVWCLGGCSSTGSGAAESQRILLLAHDDAPDAASREGAVVARAGDGLARSLLGTGHRILDQGGLGNVRIAPGASRAALIDAARDAASAPTDVLVLYSVTTSVETFAAGRRARVTVRATALRPDSGVRLAGRSLGAQVPLRPDCGPRCERDALGAAAGLLAADVGAALAPRLRPEHIGRDERTRSDPDRAFAIRLGGFGPEDQAAMEHGLQRLPGYAGHRLVYAGHTRLEMSYETRLGSARLQRELQDLLALQGLRSRVGYADGAFVVDRILTGRIPRRAADVPDPETW
jgi:hypothetical protein